MNDLRISTLQRLTHLYYKYARCISFKLRIQICIREYICFISKTFFIIVHTWICHVINENMTLMYRLYIQVAITSRDNKMIKNLSRWSDSWNYVSVNISAEIQARYCIEMECVFFFYDIAISLIIHWGHGRIGSFCWTYVLISSFLIWTKKVSIYSKRNQPFF